MLTTVEDQELWAENVTFGAYKLNEDLKKRISSVEPMELAISPELLSQMNENLISGRRSGSGYNGGYNNGYDNGYGNSYGSSYGNSYGSSYGTGPEQLVHQQGNVLYYGRQPSAPEIGDVRVTFQKVVPAKVTIISQVNNDTFKPFKAKNGKKFETLVMGQQTSEEIFDAEHAENNTWLWILRLLGISMVIGGLKGIFSFLETLLKVVPFVANIVGWGIGLICTVIGFVWSLIVIAIAWLFYRPVLGITLLVVAGFLVWVFAFKGKEKLKKMMANKEESQPAQPAQPAQ